MCILLRLRCSASADIYSLNSVNFGDAQEVFWLVLDKVMSHQHIRVKKKKQQKNELNEFSNKFPQQGINNGYQTRTEAYYESPFSPRLPPPPAVWGGCWRRQVVLCDGVKPSIRLVTVSFHACNGTPTFLRSIQIPPNITSRLPFLFHSNNMSQYGSWILSKCCASAVFVRFCVLIMQSSAKHFPVRTSNLQPVSS